MNFQFLQNTYPPPTQSLLQYQVVPDTVFVSTDTQQTYANLTFNVFNPSDSAVACQVFKFGLLVGADAGSLTETAEGLATSSSDSAWSFPNTPIHGPDDPPNLISFEATPVSGQASLALGSNATLTFQLNGILVNAAVGVGGTPITITEATGSDPDNPTFVQGQLTIGKAEPTLQITDFAANPPSPVDPGTDIMLSWAIVGAEYWLLYDDSGNQLYDSQSGHPPDAMQYGPVTPAVDTTYFLTAYAGQIYASQPQEVVVRAVQFVGNPVATPPVAQLGQNVVLSWVTRNASQLVISASGFETVTLNAPAGQYDYFPQAPNNEWTVKPTENITYTLDAYGPNNSHAQAQVNVSINPPTIVSFTATPTVLPVGQPVILSWQTTSCTAASLLQRHIGESDNTPLATGLAVNDTNYQVTATGRCTYTLQVEGYGPTATREVTVSDPGNVFAIDTALNMTAPFGSVIESCVFDGSHVWITSGNGLAKLPVSQASQNNQNVLSQTNLPQSVAYDGTSLWLGEGIGNVYKIQPNDGSVMTQTRPVQNLGCLLSDGTYVWVADLENNALLRLSVNDLSQVGPSIEVGSRVFAMTYDGTYLWAAGNDNATVSRFSSDGSQVGSSIPVGNSPQALLFDGAYLWVANSGDNTVTKLEASTGNQVGLYEVGNSPCALAYDGAYLWVANYSDQTVSVLQASDGSQAEAPIAVSGCPAALAFDGFFIWVAVINAGNLLQMSVHPISPENTQATD